MMRKQTCCGVACGVLTGITCLVLLAEPAAAQQKTTDAAAQEYAVIVALQGKRLYKKAAERWEQFIKDYPRNKRTDRAYHNLGACQLHLNDYEAAAKTYGILLQKFPKFASRDAAEFNLGLAQFNLAIKNKQPDDFRTAAKTFAAVPDNHPKSELVPSALYYQAECFYHAGDVNQAVPLYQQLVTDHPKSRLLPDAYYALGTAQQELGLFTDAAATYESFTKQFPDNRLSDECRLRRGLCLFNAEQFKDSEKIFSDLSKKSDFPFADLVLLQLAQCRHKADDQQKALQILETLLKKYPESAYQATALLEQGQCLYETGKFQDAEQPLKTVLALKKPGESANAAYWLAKTLIRLDKPADAVQVLDKAIAAYPDSPDLPLLRLTRVDALYEQPEKRANTVAMYVEFATKHAEHELAPHALYMAGFAALVVEDYAAAAKHSAAFLNKGDWAEHELIPDVLFVAGESRLLAEEPDIAEAEKHYVRLLKEFPEHDQSPRAQVRVGFCRFQTQKYDDVVRTLSQAVKQLKQPELQAEAHLLIGRSHSEAGRTEDAVKAFQSALNAHSDWPRADEVRLRLAIKLRTQEKLSEAENHLKKILADFPESRFRGETLYELGQIAEAQQKHDDALKRYRTVLAEFDGSDSAPLAAYGIGHVLFLQGKFDAAAEAFTQLLDKYGESDIAAQGRYDRGIAYYRLQKYDAALKDLQTFLATKPSEDEAREARFAVALCQIGLKKHGDAVDTLQGLLNDTPDDEPADRIYYELAYAQKELQQNQQATATFQQLVDKYPDSEFVAEAWYNIGRSYRDAEQWKQAGDAYSAGAKTAKTPKWREALQYELGYVRYRTEKYKEAADTFVSMLKEFPEGAHAVGATHLAGECLFKQGEWSKALPYFEQSIEHKDERYLARSLYRAGASAARLKQWSTSQKHYEALLKRFPKFDQRIDARYGLGLALQMQEKLDDAREQYKQVLTATKGKNTKTRAQAQFMLGECDFREKKYEDAIVRYVEATIYPDKDLQAQCHYESGRCFIELKRYDEALESLKTVVEKYPDSTEAKRASQLITSLKKKS